MIGYSLYDADYDERQDQYPDWRHFRHRQIVTSSYNSHKILYGRISDKVDAASPFGKGAKRWKGLVWKHLSNPSNVLFKVRTAMHRRIPERCTEVKGTCLSCKNYLNALPKTSTRSWFALNVTQCRLTKYYSKMMTPSRWQLRFCLPSSLDKYPTPLRFRWFLASLPSSDHTDPSTCQMRPRLKAPAPNASPGSVFLSKYDEGTKNYHRSCIDYQCKYRQTLFSISFFSG